VQSEENKKLIEKKLKNRTPFIVAFKNLNVIYQKLISLLVTLLNDNVKSCQHFLTQADEFLFQKCQEKCPSSIRLMRTAFISTKNLKNSPDLNGENVIY